MFTLCKFSLEINLLIDKIRGVVENALISIGVIFQEEDYLKKKSLYFLLCIVLLTNIGYVANADETIGNSEPKTSDISSSVEDKIFYSTGGSEYEPSTFSENLIVGQTGQIRRPKDSPLKDTIYSFDMKVSDPSILSFDEAGNWKALKPGKTQVLFGLSNGDSHKKELKQLGLDNLKMIVNEVAVFVDVTVSDIPHFTGFVAEGLSRNLVVGQTGQLKRPADHYLAQTEYSFNITVSDSSILSFDEKGQWQALKPGEVTVHYSLSDISKNQAFADELNRLGLTSKWVVQEVAMEPFKVTILENIAPMYRLYNPNSGEHFYTSTVSERNNLRKIGWRDEGIGWQAPTNGAEVYRLYNPNAGDHHYTTSVGERDYLVKVGWKYEGVNWYSGGDKPVYRVYNPNAKKAGSHHYTLSASERDYLVKLGWRDEGIGWYAAE